MGNENSHIGTTFETAVRNYLAANACIDVRREVKHGAKDQGDLRATVHGHSCVIECKRVERATPKLMADWRLQTTVEQQNAGADMGVLVTWRKGKGYRWDASPTGQRAKSFGENLAHMTVETLLMLIDAKGEVAAHELALQTWVTLPLSEVAVNARDWEVVE